MWKRLIAVLGAVLAAIGLTQWLRHRHEESMTVEGIDSESKAA